MRAIQIAAVVALTTLTLWTTGCQKLMNSVSRQLVVFTDVHHEQPASAEIKTLHVKTRVGDITVHADSPDAVRIDAVVRLESERVATTNKGEFADHVLLIANGDKLTIADAHTGDADEKDWSVEFVVHAPPSWAISLNTGVGDLLLEDATGLVQLDTGVGDIRLAAGVASSVEATTGVGDLDLELAGVAQGVRAETGTGDITLRIRETPPSQDVHLETGVGDITVTLPSTAAGVFDLRTGVGSIAAPGRDGIVVNKNRGPSSKAAGTVGEGGPKYTLATGVGDITVK